MFLKSIKESIEGIKPKSKTEVPHKFVCLKILILTQSKSKTPISRSVHCKFHCISVVLDRTRHGIYII